MVETVGVSLYWIDQEWKRLQGVIDRRAAEARAYQEQHGKEESPGMSTGLLVKRVRISGKRSDPVTTTTYTLDSKTLRELRCLEYLAMKLFAEERQEQRAATANHTPMVAELPTDRPLSLTFHHGAAPARRPEPAKRAA